MKVLFLSASTEKINMPTLPLGLACVAASTRRAGHEVALIDLKLETDPRFVLREAIEGFRPEMIGLSVRNIDDQNMENTRFLLDPVKQIVAYCRNLSEATIVLGGAGYSLFPESALSFLGADLGVQGEGESVVPALIERMEQGAALTGVPGLYLPGRGLQCQRTFVKDLDTLPLPDPGLWFLTAQSEEIWMPVQTRRGCSFGCSYCSTGMIEGRVLRRHSPEAMVGWIARWREAGVRRFYFVDNTFNVPPSDAKEICRKLIERELDLRWWNILYPKDVDGELVELMARAGCEHASIGFESGSQRILKNLNKAFTVQEVRKISERLRGCGIKQMGFLLLGSPGETKESVEESIAFADSLKMEALKISIGVRIYPSTDLAKRAVEEGLISSEGELLFPRFYLARSVEGWLPETMKKLAATRRHWMVQA